MAQSLPLTPKSYQVIIRPKHQPDDLISAPIWFPTPEEAREFGELSIRVLGYYIWIDAWRIVSCELAPTHTLKDGKVIRLASAQVQ